MTYLRFQVYAQMIRKMKSLLQGAPDLLAEFKYFIPVGRRGADMVSALRARL